MELVLKDNVDLDFSDATGTTALHYVSARNDYAAVHIFLTLGANVCTHNRWGEAPLHMACARGSLESVSLLLQAGAEANELDLFDKTPMRLAYESSLRFVNEKVCSAIMGKLIEYGSNVDLSGNDGTTVLHAACQNSSSQQMVRYLLAYGATVDAVDKNGETPLHVACRCGYVDVIRLLLEHYANPNLACTRLGRTPLHVACSNHGNLECVQCLIDHGADCTIPDINGYPPVVVAANNLDLEVVQSMLFTVFIDCCITCPP